MSWREDMKKWANDPESVNGIWYEIKKEKFTIFEKNGKCNRVKVTAQMYEKDPTSGQFDCTKPIFSG